MRTLMLPNAQSWPEMRFRFLANTNKGRLPKQDEANGFEKIPYLSMEYLRGETEAIGLVTSKGMLVAKDKDIILLWDGSNAGEFLSAKYGAVSSTAALVEVKEQKLYRGYFYWICKAAEPILKTFTNGMGIPHVDGEFLSNLKLPVASNYQTQRLIADYLDRETARIDALVAEKEKMLALLEEKRAALISRAVTRGLNPDAPMKPSGAPWFDQTPENWSIERLKWLIKSVSSGVSVNASDQPVEGDGFGVLKTSAVAGGRFKPDENKTVWDTEFDRLACPVTQNTIIMSRMNTPALVGESGYVEFDYPNLFLPDRLWQISFNEERVYVPFMALLLSSKEARHALSSMATGTSPSMKNLAIEEMSSLLVPLPPIHEQKTIHEEVSRQDAILHPLKQELGKSLSILKERRAALITAAVTGQVPIEEMRT